MAVWDWAGLLTGTFQGSGGFLGTGCEACAAGLNSSADFSTCIGAGGDVPSPCSAPSPPCLLTVVWCALVGADVTPPVVTLLEASKTTLEAGGAAWEEPGATAFDFISGPLAVTVGGATVDARPASVPTTYVVEYTATDGAGNVGRASRRVVVDDTLAPVLVLSVAGVTLEAGEAHSLDPSWFSATDQYLGDVRGRASSNMSDLPVPPASTPVTLAVRVDVSDGRGNAATPVFLPVTLTDTRAADLDAGDLAQEGGSAWWFPLVAKAQDLVDGDIRNLATLTHVNSSLMDLPHALPQCGFERQLDQVSEAMQAARVAVAGTVAAPVDVHAPAGSQFMLRYEVVDRAGNRATSVRTVTVVDTLAPLVSVVGEAEVELEAHSEAEAAAGSFAGYVDGGANAVDQLDGNVAAWVCVGVKRYGPRAMAVDASGAVAGLNAVVMFDWSDFSVPALGVVAAEGNRSLVTGTWPAGTLFVVEYRVSDAAGRVGTASRHVLVVDRRAPHLRLVAAEGRAFVVPYGTEYREAGAVAEDVSEPAGVLVAIRGAAGVDVFSPGEYAVEYEARDRFRNTKRTSRRVVVEAFVTPGVEAQVEVVVDVGLSELGTAEALEAELSAVVSGAGLGRFVFVTTVGAVGEALSVNNVVPGEARARFYNRTGSGPGGRGGGGDDGGRVRREGGGVGGGGQSVVRFAVRENVTLGYARASAVLAAVGVEAAAWGNLSNAAVVSVAAGVGSSDDGSASEGLAIPVLLVGVAAGGLAFVAALAVVVVWKRRGQKKSEATALGAGLAASSSARLPLRPRPESSTARLVLDGSGRATYDIPSLLQHAAVGGWQAGDDSEWEEADAAGTGDEGMGSVAAVPVTGFYMSATDLDHAGSGVAAWPDHYSTA
jgi:hypothetical protein